MESNIDLARGLQRQHLARLARARQGWHCRDWEASHRSCRCRERRIGTNGTDGSAGTDDAVGRQRPLRLAQVACLQQLAQVSHSGAPTTTTITRLTPQHWPPLALIQPSSIRVSIQVYTMNAEEKNSCISLHRHKYMLVCFYR